MVAAQWCKILCSPSRLQLPTRNSLGTKFNLYGSLILISGCGVNLMLIIYYLISRSWY